MTLIELDAYARLTTPVRAASGSELLLEDGRRVLDLYGGHCVNTLGAGDDALLRAIDRQWRALSFTTNLVDTSARARFLEAFGATLPAGEWSVFLSNSGAEANENALRAAFLATGREVVVAFTGAFHGRTAGAAAVSDAEDPYPRTPFLVRRVPFGDLAAAEAAIDRDVAAVILEPIQSLAGVVTPPPGFLEGLRAQAARAGALLVFDEVQTGNGRLGTPWAAQAYGVVPDVITTAKGAAGGLPIGITVLAQRALPARVRGRFGSTFGGGPAVLAAATEVARRVAAPGFGEHVRRVSDALAAAASRAPVRRVRGRGLLLGLELEEDWSGAAVRDALLGAGVLVGTTHDPQVLRLTPALTLSLADAERLRVALDECQAVCR